MLKHVRGEDELEMARLFSEPQRRADPRNHCIPMLDHLVPPEAEGVGIIVLPLLRHVESPPFETVGQVLDFCEQIMDVRMRKEFMLSF